MQLSGLPWCSIFVFKLFCQIWSQIEGGYLAFCIGLFVTWNTSVEFLWCSLNYGKLTWCSVVLLGSCVKVSQLFSLVCLFVSLPLAVQVKLGATASRREREAPWAESEQAADSCSKQLVSPALLIIYFVLGHCPRVMTNVLQILLYITCAWRKPIHLSLVSLPQSPDFLDCKAR